MKLFGLIAFFIASTALARPEVGPAPVKHLYIPSGFDSNDSAEVVVTGEFPNPCYRRNTVAVQVRENKIKIRVTAIAPREKSSCPEMIVPFKEVISLGNLQGGNYQVSVNGAIKDKLIVKEAGSQAVDDHLYAAIDELEDKGEGNYLLRGWRYSPCIELEKIEIISNGKDTLSVLPIMKQVSDFCPMKLTPVAYPVRLDFNGLRTHEPLIHVRTMDGKSFNSIIDLGGRR